MVSDRHDQNEMLTAMLARHLDGYTDLDRRHPPSPQHRALRDSDGFRVTIVRNPWARLRPAWHDELVADEEWGRIPCESTSNRILASGDECLQYGVTKDFDLFVRWLGGSVTIRRNVRFVPRTMVLAHARPDRVGRSERFTDEVQYYAGVLYRDDLDRWGHRFEATEWGEA